MSLIICAECSREISNKAAACPQCGCPVAKSLEQLQLPVTVNCLVCKKEYPFNEEICSHCGLFNSQKYKILQPNDENVEAKHTCDNVNVANADNNNQALVIAVVLGVVIVMGGILYKLDQDDKAKWTKLETEIKIKQGIQNYDALQPGLQELNQRLDNRFLIDHGYRR